MNHNPDKPDMISSYGTIAIDPTGEVIAGSRITVTFTYTVGSFGLRVGGSLRIRTPNDGWDPPLAHRKQVPKRIENQPFTMADSTYCTHNRSNLSASLTGTAAATLELSAEFGVGPLSTFMVATLCGGNLTQGDTITIVYGDRTWGEDGIAVQKVAPTPDLFVAHVDIEGNGEYHPLDDRNLDLTVLPGPVTQFNVVGPAIVKPGQSFSVKISGTDAFRNRPESSWEGGLRVSCSDSSTSVPGGIRLLAEENNRTAVSEVRVKTEGIHRLSVEPEAGGERSVSNPIWCTNRDLQVYFGDLHCHSFYHGNGRSLGTPEEGYLYGRDVAGLDFMGITDGGGYKSEGWVETQEVTNQFYEPGKFVTFKGFEYGYTLGHRNVIYRDCEVEPILDFSDGFFEHYHGRKDRLIIPHHTKVRTEWDYHDPELEPLVEVYSCWGSGLEHADPLWNKSEYEGAGVFNALKRGYRMGFIASGDSHSGMPGRSYPQGRQWFMHQKSGFACVFASEFTREAIFDALRKRQCYATTGVRALLEFSVNDNVMGEEAAVQSPTDVRSIRVHVIGSTRLKSLCIVKNNTCLVERELDRQEEFFEHYDTVDAAQDDFYYVRIVQEDGNTIWSSPTWIDLQD